MAKSKYVDGYVIPIPKKNTAKYRKMAREASHVWKKFGALNYKECMMDDAVPNKFVTFTFPKMVRIKPGETVWFSFIEFKSRKHRDAVNKKVISYFEKKYDEADMQMPFDMNRFAYGGFTVQVSS